MATYRNHVSMRNINKYISINGIKRAKYKHVNIYSKIHFKMWCLVRHDSRGWYWVSLCEVHWGELIFEDLVHTQDRRTCPTQKLTKILVFKQFLKLERLKVCPHKMEKLTKGKQINVCVRVTYTNKITNNGITSTRWVYLKAKP